MRIELNSGGLTGTASLSTMQSEVTALLGGADVFLSALRSVKSYTCNINGGVGSLQGALDEVELRIQTAETTSSNLSATKDKIGSFIELTKTVDLTVSGLVNRNKHEFYNLNEWSRPPQKEEEKEWYEKLYDWACGVGDSIAETAQKAWNGIKSFCSSVKEKLDELFAGFQEWWKDHTTVTPIEIKDEVFDDSRYAWDNNSNNDFYGGRQHGPKNEVNQDGIISSKEERSYVDIIKRNTGKEMSEAELYQYLSELNSHGCGYTAMVNTILEYYCHRTNGEEEFRNKFGFPLRDDNGNLNYNALTIDIYSKTNGLVHNSSSEDSRKVILESYMGDSGIDGNSSVKVTVNKRVHVTSNNVDNYIREGKQIIIRGQNLHIYADESKSSVADCGGAGHAMVVTGVTKDGLLIVSTWGRKGYIDLKDNGRNVSWIDDKGNRQSGKIDMSFSTVEFE